MRERGARQKQCGVGRDGIGVCHAKHASLAQAVRLAASEPHGNTQLCQKNGGAHTCLEEPPVAHAGIVLQVGVRRPHFEKASQRSACLLGLQHAGVSWGVKGLVPHLQPIVLLLPALACGGRRGGGGGASKHQAEASSSPACCHCPFPPVVCMVQPPARQQAPLDHQPSPGHPSTCLLACLLVQHFAEATQQCIKHARPPDRKSVV